MKEERILFHCSAFLKDKEGIIVITNKRLKWKECRSNRLTINRLLKHIEGVLPAEDSSLGRFLLQVRYTSNTQTRSYRLSFQGEENSQAQRDKLHYFLKMIINLRNLPAKYQEAIATLQEDPVLYTLHSKLVIGKGMAEESFWKCSNIFHENDKKVFINKLLVSGIPNKFLYVSTSTGNNSQEVKINTQTIGNIIKLYPEIPSHFRYITTESINFWKRFIKEQHDHSTELVGGYLPALFHGRSLSEITFSNISQQSSNIFPKKSPCFINTGIYIPRADFDNSVFLKEKKGEELPEFIKEKRYETSVLERINRHSRRIIGFCIKHSENESYDDTPSFQLYQLQNSEASTCGSPVSPKEKQAKNEIILTSILSLKQKGSFQEFLINPENARQAENDIIKLCNSSEILSTTTLENIIEIQTKKSGIRSLDYLNKFCRESHALLRLFYHTHKSSQPNWEDNIQKMQDAYRECIKDIQARIDKDHIFSPIYNDFLKLLERIQAKIIKYKPNARVGIILQHCF